MKKILITLTAIALAACTTRPAFDPASVADATADQVTRVEPLSWWTGMKMPLQLLVQGEGISEYNVTIEACRECLSVSGMDGCVCAVQCVL